LTLTCKLLCINKQVGPSDYETTVHKTLEIFVCFHRFWTRIGLTRHWLSSFIIFSRPY